jgi:CRISPR/Cas system-associated exonuclease Cas4 (RecB family)
MDFDKYIDNYIKREDRPKGIGKYFPSEVGSCLRKVWYSYKYPSEIDPELRKVFKIGDIIHDFIVEVLRSEKNPEIKLLSSELPFVEKIGDFLVSGRIDDVIKVESNGKVYIVEVKSAKSLDLINEAKENNVMQLQLYMHFTGVHDGVLLYVDKTNLKSKAFEIKYDESKAMEALNRFRKLHKHLVENTLPEPEAKLNSKMSWMCKYCEYKDMCDKDIK